MTAFQLIEKARAALARETRIDLRYAPIEINVAHDALLLHGEVDGIEAKRVAVDAVKAVPGLPRVADQLRVRPAVPQGDTAVRDEVYTRLVQEPAYAHVSISCRIEGGEQVRTRAAQRPRGTIEATVSDAVVTLRGRTESPVDKYFAGVLAWKATGTRDVVNELEAADAALDRDAAIGRTIERLCERNALLRTRRIDSTVGDGTVTLRGRVETAGAKQLILHDVWYIDGVREVIDDLEVG